MKKYFSFIYLINIILIYAQTTFKQKINQEVKKNYSKIT